MNTNEESAIKQRNHDDVALLQLLNHATRYELKVNVFLNTHDARCAVNLIHGSCLG